MSTRDFLRSRLDQMIDLRHPLAVLSKRLPWAAIEAAVVPKLAHQVTPAPRVSGVDLAALLTASLVVVSARRAARVCPCG